MLENLVEKQFQIEFRGHAEAILSGDFPEAIRDLELVLAQASVPIGELIASGGGETKGTQRLREHLMSLHWPKKTFVIEKRIDNIQLESITHEIDHARRFAGGTIALEIEWNNKDPFFDRDLENFKRLHAEGAISVGVLVTRGTSLQHDLKQLVQRFAELNKLESPADLLRVGLAPTRRQQQLVAGRLARNTNFAEVWANAFVQDKYGASTTHWSKLMDRIHRGVGNPCPLLLVGLPSSIVSFEDEPSVASRDVTIDLDNQSVGDE